MNPRTLRKWQRRHLARKTTEMREKHSGWKFQTLLRIDGATSLIEAAELRSTQPIRAQTHLAYIRRHIRPFLTPLP